MTTTTPEQLEKEIDYLRQLTTGVSLPIVEQILGQWHALKRALKTYPDLMSTRPEGSDIHGLATTLQVNKSPENALMLAVALGLLRVRYNDSWLTPVSRQVEALAQAGLFEEADKLAKHQPDLQIGKERLAATKFINRSRERFKGNISDLVRLRPALMHIAQVLVNRHS